MNKKSMLSHLCFIIIPVFLFTSCTSLQYGKRLIVKNKDINVVDLKLIDGKFSAKLLMEETVSEKAVLKWGYASDSIGYDLFATCFFTAMYPVVVILSAKEITFGYGRKKREATAALLAPIGGCFWYPTHDINRLNKLKTVKIIEKNQRPIRKSNIIITEHNGTSPLETTKTDTNGNFEFSGDRFLQMDDHKVEIDLSYQDMTDGVTLDLIPYFKYRFGKSKKLSPQERNSYLKYAQHYQKIFLDLTHMERIYLIEKLSYKEPCDPWQLVAAFTSVKMHNYLNPTPPKLSSTIPEPPVKPLNPPLVPEPVLPPVVEIEQSPFENLKMFTERMNNAKLKRKEQINEIIQYYKLRVNIRNKNIVELKQKYEKEYENYLTAVKKYNLNEKRKIAHYKKEVKKRRLNASDKEQELLLSYFDNIFGKPQLANSTFSDGKPKYYPEKEIMVATLYYGELNSPSLKQDIAIHNVKPGNQSAGKFYADLKNGGIRPSVSIDYGNNQFGIEKVKINRGSSVLWGKPTFDKLQKAESKKVLLGYKDSTLSKSLSKKYSGKTLTIEKYEAPETLELQSAYVKDVNFETFIANELKEFNDDIPALLRKTNKKRKDDSSWLFVIGIEDYKKTNKINFSKRSSEMFTDVAMKVLGVPEGNTFLLIDDGKKDICSLKTNRIYDNTAASIKDQLRYLQRDIKRGDKIYFYYSGHGIPSINDSKKPYILAKDQTPDFIHDEKFFRVDEIYKTLSKSRADEIVVFMDSCFTGETDGSSVFLGSKAATRLVPKKTNFDKNKMAVMCAGTSKQFSNMYKEKGHRMFSYYLMKSLLSLKGNSTLGSLYSKVKTNTKSMSRKLGGSNLQVPTLMGNTKIKIW